MPKKTVFIAGPASRNSGGRGESPMMEQFWRAKREHPQALLFFRMGDFYELFHEDAQIASRELGIALTSRAKGEGAIPMAGVPVRSMESYLVRLVQKGHKVAICEQLSDPRASKGLVDRAVVRVVTPGTLTEENLLDARENNFLCSLAVDGKDAGLAWVDISTGRFHVALVGRDQLLDELIRIAPAELLWNPLWNDRDPALYAELSTHLGTCLTQRDPWHFDHETAHRTLTRHFGVATLEGFGIENDSCVVPAAGSVIEYLEETQRNACEHVASIELVERSRFLVLDRATRACLELVRPQRGERTEGTLLATLDASLTPMGGRLLRQWVLAPLREVPEIMNRQQGVAELVGDPFLREDVRGLLGGVRDLERLVAKVSTARANARDLMTLATSLATVGPLRERLRGVLSGILGELRDGLDALEDVVGRIRESLVDEPPAALREGGLIRDGFSPELDELRRLAGDGKSWMARFQAEETKRTGIIGLKVGFNSVFGYFLEVPRAQVDRVPPEYARKQTIKAAERYVTPELEEYETKVRGAEERARELEYEIYCELRAAVASEARRILDTASALSCVDVLAALAQRAAEHRYVAPQVDESDEIAIEDGRHPVLERSPGVASFVPNDSRLDRGDRMVTILTGPNMAGKSTYIRQTALIVLMAQMGSFVPAGKARIGVADRIFTRIGSADDISHGSSTFMVEMVEIANILNNAGARSLVVLDEVGRGTSTFDGLALAWAIVEHLHDRIGARTLFATHYHQLTDLAVRLRGVCNKSVAVREWEDEIVFLHRIVEGGTDRSYGIHVARLAGVPTELLARARAILRDLEMDAEHMAPRIADRTPSGESLPPPPAQLMLFEDAPSPVERALDALDPDRLSPMDALLALRTLKDLLPGARRGQRAASGKP